jgi:hypothetical protein
MKSFLTGLILIIGTSTTIRAQRFYVEKTSEGYESPIISKLIEKNYKVTLKKDSADYSIICLVEKAGMGRGKASIVIYNNKSGDLIAKSKEVHGQTSAFNGYQNPKIRAMNKIANDYLIDMVDKLPKLN